MLDAASWLKFERALSREDVQAIEDRIQYLDDVLPRYAARPLPHEELGDLDLDLMTYLRSGGVSNNEGLTPWLIHCDWFEDVRGQKIDGAVESAVAAALGVSGRSKVQAVEYGLGCLRSCIELLRVERRESEAATLLTAIDFLVVRILGLLGELRLQTLIDRRFGADGIV